MKKIINVNDLLKKKKNCTNLSQGQFLKNIPPQKKQNTGPSTTWCVCVCIKIIVYILGCQGKHTQQSCLRIWQPQVINNIAFMFHRYIALDIYLLWQLIISMVIKNKYIYFFITWLHTVLMKCSLQLKKVNLSATGRYYLQNDKIQWLNGFMFTVSDIEFVERLQ